MKTPNLGLLMLAVILTQAARAAFTLSRIGDAK